MIDRRVAIAATRIIPLIVLMTLSACTVTPPPVPQSPPPSAVKLPPYPDPYRIVAFHGCYDGDTCAFSLADVPPLFGDHISVRIMGIDTPEQKGKCEREKMLALQAQRMMEGLLTQARRIWIEEPTRDKYFRILARLMADGEEVGPKLIQAHLAVAYNGGTKTMDWCTIE